MSTFYTQKYTTTLKKIGLCALITGYNTAMPMALYQKITNSLSSYTSPVSELVLQVRAVGKDAFNFIDTTCYNGPSTIIEYGKEVAACATVSYYQGPAILNGCKLLYNQVVPICNHNPLKLNIAATYLITKIASYIVYEQLTIANAYWKLNQAKKTFTYNESPVALRYNPDVEISKQKKPFFTYCLCKHILPLLCCTLSAYHSNATNKRKLFWIVLHVSSWSLLK